MKCLLKASVFIIILSILTLGPASALAGAQDAYAVTYMNARVVEAAPDGNSLTILDGDGRTRALRMDRDAGVRLGNLQMGDEVLITARGSGESLTVTRLKVTQMVSAAGAAGMAPPSVDAVLLAQARRQRPNPYSLLNPSVPLDSPASPWARRRAESRAWAVYVATSAPAQRTSLGGTPVFTLGQAR